MITIFRRVRKKLIEQDNVRKYLFYAIGEILLVVAGILIALQVNNWNEAAKHYTRNVFGPFLLEYDQLVETGPNREI